MPAVKTGGLVFARGPSVPVPAPCTYGANRSRDIPFNRETRNLAFAFLAVFRYERARESRRDGITGLVDATYPKRRQVDHIYHRSSRDERMKFPRACATTTLGVARVPGNWRTRDEQNGSRARCRILLVNPGRSLSHFIPSRSHARNRARPSPIESRVYTYPYACYRKIARDASIEAA